MSGSCVRKTGNNVLILILNIKQFSFIKNQYYTCCNQTF